MRPKKGAALFFLDALPSGRGDPAAEVLECPVLRGHRWVAVKALAAIKYTDRIDPTVCEDTDDRCEEWAGDGECRANPTFMVGSPSDPGSCRKACGVCKPQAEAAAVA